MQPWRAGKKEAARHSPQNGRTKQPQREIAINKPNFIRWIIVVPAAVLMASATQFIIAVMASFVAWMGVDIQPNSAITQATSVIAWILLIISHVLFGAVLVWVAAYIAPQKKITVVIILAATLLCISIIYYKQLFFLANLGSISVILFTIYNRRRKKTFIDPVDSGEAPGRRRGLAGV